MSYIDGEVIIEEIKRSFQKQEPMTDKMPERIFAGYFANSPIWGAITKDTHPDNKQYLSKDWLIQQLEGMRINHGKIEDKEKAMGHNTAIDAMIERINND